MFEDCLGCLGATGAVPASSGILAPKHKPGCDVGIWVWLGEATATL